MVKDWYWYEGKSVLGVEGLARYGEGKLAEMFSDDGKATRTKEWSSGERKKKNLGTSRESLIQF